MVKILVVDDDLLIRVVMKHALTGYEVLLAEDGRQAMALVEWEQPDLILMDIMMPGIDGLSTAQLIAKRHDIPIIFVSEVANKINFPANIEAAAVISKPFDPEALRIIVADCLTKATLQKMAKRA